MSVNVELGNFLSFVLTLSLEQVHALQIQKVNPLMLSLII